MASENIVTVLRQTAESEAFRYVVERGHLLRAVDEIERLRAALAEARSACVGISTFLTNEELAWACNTWPWVGGDEATRAAGVE